MRHITIKDLGRDSGINLDMELIDFINEVMNKISEDHQNCRNLIYIDDCLPLPSVDFSKLATNHANLEFFIALRPHIDSRESEYKRIKFPTS